MPEDKGVFLLPFFIKLIWQIKFDFVVVQLIIQQL
jgi:hypothetical protein